MSQAARRATGVAAVAAGQCGVVSRGQLTRAGVSVEVVRSNVEAGRWAALSRGVVALHNGPLTGEQKAWFAVLDGGRHCVLAGITALHHQGLNGFPVERVQVAVPFGGRPARHELYVRRVSRRLTTEARHPARRPPMMRVGVALVDALENMTLPLRGCALVAAVVQQRLLRTVDVRPVIAGAGTLPHRAAYLAVAGDVEGGAQSLTEIDFRVLARRAGLPTPRGQAVRLDRLGRRRYLDADFGPFAVEVDGAVHLKPLAWWDDTWRLNEIIIAGKPTLRFPSVGIYLQPDRVIDQLRAAGRRWL
jgi:hypothetical protein